MYNISIIGSLGNPCECNNSFTIDANYVKISLQCIYKVTLGTEPTEPNRRNKKSHRQIAYDSLEDISL